MEFTPQVLALIGAATAMGGVALVVWGAQTMARSRSDGAAESLLAPTLAVDTLDPDLRIAYMRTLVVDARESARDASRSALGRELRRALVALQAVRFVGHTSPDEARLLNLVDEVCDASSDHPLSADTVGHHAELARTLRISLLREVEDLQSKCGGSRS